MTRWRFAVKSGIKRLLRSAGYEVRSIVAVKASANPGGLEKWVWLQPKNIGTILDIGANTGQFAREIHTVLPDALLYSFEPMQECYEQLVKNMQCVPNFRAFNLGLSDREGQVEFYKSEQSASSSLLPMADLHRSLFPHTAKSAVIDIKTVCLDSLASQIEVKGNLLIKMDVQGAEDKVIRGGTNFFKMASVVVAEVAYYTLYEGQPLFQEIFELLVPLGFSYAGNLSQFNGPTDGLPVYANAIFMNSSERRTRNG